MSVRPVRASLPLLAVGALLAGCATSMEGPTTATARLHVAVPAYGVRVVNPHRWVAADVARYTVTLQKQTAPDTFEGLDPARVVSLDPKAEPAETTASFTGLPRAVYRAVVLAEGNIGGTSPELPLNGTGTLVPLDLTAGNREAEASVQLDGVSADFGAGVGLTPPTENGPFLAPSAAPTAGVDAD